MRLYSSPSLSTSEMLVGATLIIIVWVISAILKKRRAIIESRIKSEMDAFINAKKGKYEIKEEFVEDDELHHSFRE
jgi:hypothetical protein